MLATLFLAHAGHEHSEAIVRQSLYMTILHKEWFVTLPFLLVLLTLIFAVLGLFRLAVMTRLLALVPVIIALAVVYAPHQPTVSGILLSAGFIMTFLTVFTMLGGSQH